MKPLVDYRNLVAHNPVSLVLFLEEETAPFREGITKPHGDDHVVEFEEFSRVVERVQKIKDDMYEALALFRLESLNLDALPTYPPLESQTQAN